MSLESFIKRFAKVTEEYKFYNGEVTLRYEVDEHRYLLVTPEGLKVLDGVTSVVHILDKSEALIPWACKMMAQKLLAGPMPTWWTFHDLVNDAKKAHKEKLEEAGNIGHIAHAWIEKQIKRAIAEGHGAVSKLFVPDPLPQDAKAASCCEAALDWMVTHNVKWVCTERKIYSRTCQYAGTMDGLCWVDSCPNRTCCSDEFGSRLTVADWKTSNYLYLEYCLQTAAYQQAYVEEMGEPVTDRWVIRLGKEDGAFDPWHLPAADYPADFEAFRLALELGRLVATIKERMKFRDRAVKDEQRAVRKAEREAALKIKCPKADKYKGSRLTTCNDGEGQCEACAAIYRAAQADKLSK